METYTVRLPNCYYAKQQLQKKIDSLQKVSILV